MVTKETETLLETLTPMFAKEDVKRVKRLIKAGADVNARNEQNKTLLFISIDNRFIKTTRLLLQAGADVQSDSGVGWSYLQYCFRYGHLEMAKLLLDFGANLTQDLVHSLEFIITTEIEKNGKMSEYNKKVEKFLQKNYYHKNGR